MLRIFPPFPTEIAILCHHAETNDIFLLDGRVGSSPITRANKVELFLVETFVLRIGFRLPSNFSSTIYLYWEQIVTKNYCGVKYSLCVAYVSSFRNFVDMFRNVGVVQALVAANIIFQEQLFKLEQPGNLYPTEPINLNRHR